MVNAAAAFFVILLAVMLFALPASATPIEIANGVLGGLTFNDKTVRFEAGGVSVSGSGSYDLDFYLDTGHYTAFFGGSFLFVNGQQGSDAPGGAPQSLRLDFTFAPINLNYRDPGSHATPEPFAMTGQLIWPDLGTIDYVGHGTLFAGVPSLGISSVGFVFQAPEASITVLLAIGLGAVLVAGALAQRSLRKRS